MKTWLKKCGGKSGKYREKIWAVGAVIILIAACLGPGRFWGGREGDTIDAVPEPECCALCGSGEQYHAPCMVKLATGEVGELRVYDPDPRRGGELAPIQRTGTFSFLRCADLVGYRDTSRHVSHVILPEETEPVNPAYFCRNCRTLLVGTAAGGYVLADLYDVGAIQMYPIADGAEYYIRDYMVSISEGKGPKGIEINVTGLLP